MENKSIIEMLLLKNKIFLITYFTALSVTILFSYPVFYEKIDNDIVSYHPERYYHYILRNLGFIHGGEYAQYGKHPYEMMAMLFITILILYISLLIPFKLVYYFKRTIR